MCYVLYTRILEQDKGQYVQKKGGALFNNSDWLRRNIHRILIVRDDAFSWINWCARDDS